MPFPRLGAFAYWTFLFGGLLYYSSTLFRLVPDAGWFASEPLSTEEFSPGLALDFWVLCLGVAEVGAIAAAMEIIIWILKLRASGMTLSRMPLFAWAMLVTSFMILFAFTTLIVGGRRRRSTLSGPAAVLFVFTMALQSVILSALLTFAPTPWYESYGLSARAWGLDPLTDQQLAGSIMWIPAGLVYFTVALVLLVSWLERNSQEVEVEVEVALAP